MRNLVMFELHRIVEKFFEVVIYDMETPTN